MSNVHFQQHCLPQRPSEIPTHRKMPPKESKPVKGKGNLLKVPTKAEIDHDNSIEAMQWVWRSFFLLLALPLCSML
jgi:hypothetical protein